MSTGAEHWIHALLAWLTDTTQTSLPPPSVRQALESADAIELESLCEVISQSQALVTVSEGRIRILMQLIAGRSLQLQSETPEGAGIAADTLGRLYEVLCPVAPNAAAHGLQILAAYRDDESLETLAECLVESPPEQWQAVGLGLSPLWQANGEQLTTFFSLISDDFVHPTTMAVLLDLANYAVRENLLPEHPWAGQRARLAELLSSVSARLRVMEEDPAKFGDTVEQVQQTLADSVALTISLCDALALIGDQTATPSLTQALSLSHRRIQTEAAGALARLGDTDGRRRLIELASDRVARMRAVAYADELGFVEEIDSELRTPLAMAESQLASWLAAPEQFGFPPTDIELVDTCSQYWPSFDAPQACYLFRYTYQLPDGRVSNIGVAGPLTHAFNVDMGNLPPEDIYAAFAGWHAEHEDIFEVPVVDLNKAQQVEMRRLEECLQELDLEVQQPIALTFFLGEVSLLAKVSRDGQELCAITDGTETVFFPVSNHPASLSPETVLCIFRGRKLLRTFNV